MTHRQKVKAAPAASPCCLSRCSSSSTITGDTIGVKVEGNTRAAASPLQTYIDRGVPLPTADK